jgi:hypothetical protein
LTASTAACTTTGGGVSSPDVVAGGSSGPAWNDLASDAIINSIDYIFDAKI